MLSAQETKLGVVQTHRMAVAASQVVSSEPKKLKKAIKHAETSYSDEEWRPSVTFTKYDVSNKGRIRSQVTGKLIKTSNEQVIVRRIEGVPTGRRLACLVCEVFNGPKPFPEVRTIAIPKDGNELNLAADNLEWVGISKARALATKSKITLETATQICERLEVGQSIPQITKEMGVSENTIYPIQKARTWKFLCIEYSFWIGQVKMREKSRNCLEHDFHEQLNDEILAFQLSTTTKKIEEARAKINQSAN